MYYKFFKTPLNFFKVVADCAKSKSSDEFIQIDHPAPHPQHVLQSWNSMSWSMKTLKVDSMKYMLSFLQL